MELTSMTGRLEQLLNDMTGRLQQEPLREYHLLCSSIAREYPEVAQLYYKALAKILTQQQIKSHNLRC